MDQRSTDREILIRLDERTEALCSKVEMMEGRLFIGNGHPSLMTRIEMVEQNQAKPHFDCNFEKAKNKVFWWLLTAAGSAAVALVTLAVEIIRGKK